MASAGWTIVAQHPGDDYKISGSWEVQRSTRYPPVFIDFEGFDDMICLPMEEAYACHLRDEPKIGVYFGRMGERWKDSILQFISALNFSEGQFVLLYRLGDAGNATASLWADGKNTELYISYLSSSPLGDLAHQVTALMLSPDLTKVMSAWQDELGEYRWIIDRLANELNIRVLSFPQTFSREDDEQGSMEFEASCTLIRLATQVRGQLSWMLNEYGESGYEKRWRHPFPTAEYHSLTEAIIEYRQNIQTNT